MRRPNEVPVGERKLRYVLYDLCVQWGYCIPQADQDRLATSKQITAEQFATEILKAEGFVPEYEPKRVREIAQFSVQKVGTSSFSEGEQESER